MEKIRSAGWQMACTPLEDFYFEGDWSHFTSPSREGASSEVLRLSLVLNMCFRARGAKQTLVRSCRIGSGVRDRGG